MPAHKLEAHLKVCPVLAFQNRIKALPYYKCDINIMNPEPCDAADTDAVFSVEKIHRLYQKVSDKYCMEFPDLFHVYDQVKHIEAAGEKFTPELKHGNQQTKIVKIMGENGLLKGDFVEYGAGKAGLSSFIGESAEKGSSFIVVEREARRNKQDKVMRWAGHETRRETMDIKDFDLGYFADEKKDIIGVAKHLCGAATDLALCSFKLAKG